MKDKLESGKINVAAILAAVALYASGQTGASEMVGADPEIAQALGFLLASAAGWLWRLYGPRTNSPAQPPQQDTGEHETVDSEPSTRPTDTREMIERASNVSLSLVVMFAVATTGACGAGNRELTVEPLESWVVGEGSWNGEARIDHETGEAEADREGYGSIDSGSIINVCMEQPPQAPVCTTVQAGILIDHDEEANEVVMTTCWFVDDIMVNCYPVTLATWED